MAPAILWIGQKKSKNQLPIITQNTHSKPSDITKINNGSFLYYALQRPNNRILCCRIHVDRKNKEEQKLKSKVGLIHIPYSPFNSLSIIQTKQIVPSFSLEQKKRPALPKRLILSAGKQASVSDFPISFRYKSMGHNVDIPHSCFIDSPLFMRWKLRLCKILSSLFINANGKMEIFCCCHL